MFCRHCGYDLGEGYTFCPKCGKLCDENDLKNLVNSHTPERTTSSESNDTSSTEEIHCERKVETNAKPNESAVGEDAQQGNSTAEECTTESIPCNETDSVPGESNSSNYAAEDDTSHAETGNKKESSAAYSEPKHEEDKPEYDPRNQSAKPYYREEFAKLKLYEGSKFNWAAFFFAPLHQLYHHSYKLFFKTELPVLIMVILGSLLRAAGTILVFGDYSMETTMTLMSIGDWIAMGAGVIQICIAIWYGRKCNELLFDQTDGKAWEIPYDRGKAELLIVLAILLAVGQYCLIRYGSQWAMENLSANDSDDDWEQMEDWDDTKEDDVITETKGEDEEHVLSIRYACPPAYPDITYDEAFKYFFNEPSWEYFEAYNEKNEDVTIDVVEFTGGCIYMDEPVTALIQFEFSKTGNTFFPTFLSFNDVPQSEDMLKMLLDSAFDNYKSNG